MAASPPSGLGGRSAPGRQGGLACARGTAQQVRASALAVGDGSEPRSDQGALLVPADKVIGADRG